MTVIFEVNEVPLLFEACWQGARHYVILPCSRDVDLRKATRLKRGDEILILEKGSSRSLRVRPTFVEVVAESCMLSFLHIHKDGRSCCLAQQSLPGITP